MEVHVSPDKLSLQKKTNVYHPQVAFGQQRDLMGPWSPCMLHVDSDICPILISKSLTLSCFQTACSLYLRMDGWSWCQSFQKGLPLTPESKVALDGTSNATSTQGIHSS